MSDLPSGEQFEIRSGPGRAVIVEVGAAIREFEVDGAPALDGFPLEQMADGGRGQPLLPWPNRLEDGQYEFRGRTHQLPIDEVARRNASHGLTRWLNWSAIDVASDRVVLSQLLHPRPGYPFTLELRLEYALSTDGLTVSTTATNRGSDALPFGAGQHPYFSVGTPRVDDAVLHIPARGRLEFDAERRLPTGRVLAVEQTPYDFRKPRRIGEQVLDDCFNALERDGDGRARVSLSSSDTRRSLSVWMDGHYRYAQVFSGDTLAPARRRQGLAIEPMTCPPNAFHTGIDLIVLEPGESITLQWGVDVH